MYQKSIRKKSLEQKRKRLKLKPRNPPKRKKIDYNFDLRIILLLLSIIKINIFNEEVFY